MDVIDTLEEELTDIVSNIRLNPEDEGGVIHRILSTYATAPRKLWVQDEVLDLYPLETLKLVVIKRVLEGSVTYHGFWVEDTYGLHSLYQKFSYPYERNLGLTEEAVDTEEKFLNCVYNAAKYAVGTTHEESILMRLRWAACSLASDQIRLCPPKTLVQTLYSGQGFEVGFTLKEINQVFLHYWKKYQDGLKSKDPFTMAMAYIHHILPVFATIINDHR